MPTPVDVVNDLYLAFAQRDLPKVLALCSPDVEVVQSPELPWGGTYRGHAGAKEFFGKLTRAINSTVTMERLINAGDHIVAVGWTRGTVNATGATYNVPVAHVWTVREGHATRVEFYIDHPSMLAALTAKAG